MFPGRNRFPDDPLLLCSETVSNVRPKQTKAAERERSSDVFHPTLPACLPAAAAEQNRRGFCGPHVCTPPHCLTNKQVLEPEQVVLFAAFRVIKM